jgi:hypothetical protein
MILTKKIHTSEKKIKTNRKIKDCYYIIKIHKIFGKKEEINSIFPRTTKNKVDVYSENE